MKGKELPGLGWTGQCDLVREQVNPVSVGVIKPLGGLWTSPLRYDEKGNVTGTRWTEWADAESYHIPTSITRVVPEPDADIFVIDSVEHLAFLVEHYPEPDPEVGLPMSVRAPLNWPELSAYYDAVWLTNRGQIRTRFSRPSLYGWDCSTVYWLNPAFRVGEAISIGAEA